MRNFKRFLAMALTMLMVVGSFAVASFAFTDDGEFANYSKEIKVIEGLKISIGKEDGSFGYDDNITRRQMALFIARVITGCDPAMNEKSTTNYTNFTDLDDGGDYIGAISVVTNAGIIKGWTNKQGNVVYGPSNGITYQDALTMLVRGLGYGSSELDAGYPWSFILKAKELGLTDGVVDVASYEDTLCRGTVAKLLYNFLFAECADGETYVEKEFGTTVAEKTLILTTPSANYTLTGVAANQFPAENPHNYVALNELLDDGRFDTATTYYFTWDMLSGAAAGLDKADLIGASFKVLTIDGFKTLLDVELCNRVEYIGTLDSGYGKVNWEGANININGVAHRGVNKYTGIFTTKDTWYGYNEVIAYNMEAASQDSTANSGVNGIYLVDSDLNIIESKTHNIVYKYMPEFVLIGYGIPYGKLMTGGTYMPISADEYAAAVEKISTLGYAGVTYPKTTAFTKTNSIYTYFVGYDDEGDSSWDRCFYADFSYGRLKYVYKADGKFDHYEVLEGTHGASVMAQAAAIKNLSGQNYNNGSYVQYFYNPVNNTIYVGKVYDIQSGYLYYYNYGSNQIAFTESATNNWFNTIANASWFTLCTGAFPGANTMQLVAGVDNIGTLLNECLLQYVNYIYDAKANAIIGIFGNASTDYIYDKIVSYNSASGMVIRVMNSNGLYQYINITTVDNYPFYSSDGYAYEDAANAIATKFHQYDKVEIVYDSKGNYNLKHVSQATVHDVGETKATADTLIIIEDLILGPMVATVKKDGYFPAGDYVTVNGVRYYTAEEYHFGDDYYYEECHQDIEGGDFKDVITNVVDIVYYDGSLTYNAVQVANDDSATNSIYNFASMWLFTDTESGLNDNNWASITRYTGFTSLVRGVGKADGRVYPAVYSTSNYLEPGIYTLIRMADGKIFVGNKLTTFDLTTGTFMFNDYDRYQEFSHFELKEGTTNLFKLGEYANGILPLSVYNKAADEVVLALYFKEAGLPVIAEVTSQLKGLVVETAKLTTIFRKNAAKADYDVSLNRNIDGTEGMAVSSGVATTLEAFKQLITSENEHFGAPDYSALPVQAKIYKVAANGAKGAEVTDFKAAVFTTGSGEDIKYNVVVYKTVETAPGTSEVTVTYVAVDENGNSYLATRTIPATAATIMYKSAGIFATAATVDAALVDNANDQGYLPVSASNYIVEFTLEGSANKIQYNAIINGPVTDVQYESLDKLIEATQVIAP